jgi:nitrogen regulatory protein PII
MKMICAIIRPHQLENVQKSLADVGVAGMTATPVRGTGRQQGQVERYRGSEYSIDLIAKMKVEVGVSDEQCEDAIHAILESSRTGEIGDGKIFVYSLSDAYRIRTGESGEESL